MRCFAFHACLVLLSRTASGAKNGGWGSFASVLRDSSAPPQWTNCTSQDTQPRTLSIGVALTQEAYKQFTNQQQARDWAQEAVDGTNFVYMSQLNTKLVIGQLYIDDGQQNFSDHNCSVNLATKLRNFQKWTPPVGAQPWSQGLWVLLDDCIKGSRKSLQDGLTGMALQGTLCNAVSNRAVVQKTIFGGLGDVTWRVFAHEVGHIFGAGHPAGANIQLVGGGIMAYGTGHAQCALGFHPNDKAPICTRLEAALTSNCQAFTATGQTRGAFIAGLPQAPVTFNLNVVECGLFGMSFIAFCLVAGGALLCCCCLCCGCCACICLRCRKRRRNDDDYEDDDEDDEEADDDEDVGEQDEERGTEGAARDFEVE